MLCSACQSINFDEAYCSPGEGGAKLGVEFGLKLASSSNCELCQLIREELIDRSPQPMFKGGEILCNVWNWYSGPASKYRGSATMVIHEEGSNWTVYFSITADEGDMF